MFYPRYLLRIRWRICVRLAELAPVVGTVFGSLFLALIVLALLGGVQ